MERLVEDLHPSLVEFILDRLPVSDYLRFPAVCPSWCRVQRDHRRRLHLRSRLSARQMPWLLLPEDKQSPQRRLFYSPSEQQYYRLPLPTAAVQRNHSQLHSTPIGASHGWLLFLDDKILLLVNPFSGSEIQIPTPPFTTLGMNYYFALGTNYYSASLSTSPTDPNCIIFLWNYETPEDCYYCRISDKNWKSVIMSKVFNMTEIVDIYKMIDGLPLVPIICGGKLYLSWGGSKLAIIEPLSEPVKIILDMSGLPEPVSNSRKFMVESDGQIILVIVIMVKEQDKYTNRFEVFKADLNQKMWVGLESLGDKVIFLGDGHSLCLPAVSTGGPENCIYYASSLKSSQIVYDYGSHQVMSNNNWSLSENFTWSLKSSQIEYDYGSYRVMSNNHWSLSKNGEGSFDDDDLCWVVPGLC